MSSFDKYLKKEESFKDSDGLEKILSEPNIDSEIDAVIREKDNSKPEISKSDEPKKTYFGKVKQKADTQKEHIKQNYKKPVERETELTPDDRKRIKERFIHKNKLDRKERKRIRLGEHAGFLDTQKIVTGIGFAAVIFIFLLWQFNPGDESIMIIVLMLGVILFLPVGMIMGWMLFDPFMRCKIMRKMSKGRNYGIVNFVGKGKHIITKIKNFDNDFMWIKNKCWALTREGIYELDKNGEQATHGTTLDPDSFVTVTESVPTMFVDIASMQPLTFEETGREGISPEELGSTLKGWTDNQMAKVMYLKRTVDAYFVIVIISALAAAFIGYQNNQEIMELKIAVNSLMRQVQSLGICSIFF